MFDKPRIVRPTRYYSMKVWKRFNKVHEKHVGDKVYYLDMQEVMCRKFDIILIDYKTSRQRIIDIAKGFNMKNFDKGMTIFDNAMKDFDDMMKDFGKGLGGGSGGISQAKIVGNKVGVSKKMNIWSTSQSNKANKPVDIWGTKSKPAAKKRRKTKKARKKNTAKSNLDSLIGKRKPIF